jgi:hypothetical protein
MQITSIHFALLWLFLVSSSAHAMPAPNEQPARSHSHLPAVVEGRASGPDLMVGDIFGLAQLGSSGTQVGLIMGTTACNNGDADLDFLSLPNTDHPVIAQNLYRMSGGASNDDRFADVQRLTVTLSGVTDTAGQILPDAAVSVNMLIGDINGNKAVNATDIAQAKGQSGVSVSAANFRSDVNGSGTITAADVAQAKANAGHALP